MEGNHIATNYKIIVKSLLAVKSKYVVKHSGALEIGKRLKCKDQFKHMKGKEASKQIVKLPHVKSEPSSSLDGSIAILVALIKLHHVKLEPKTSLDNSAPIVFALVGPKVHFFAHVCRCSHRGLNG